MQKIEEKFKEYEDFVKTPKKELIDKIEKVAQIISEFQHMLFVLREKYIKENKKAGQIWMERFLFYKNEYPIVLKDSEIKQFIERDVEYMDVKSRLLSIENYIERCESALKNLDSIRWDIKNFIDWKKLESGVL